MSHSLQAACYADRARVLTCPIAENVQLARDTWRVRLAAPEIARTVLPGQFVMLRIAGLNDPLIGRPLALYDVHNDAAGNANEIDLVYLVKGKFTTRLAQCRAGAPLEIWGPLGNGFPAESCEHLVMVAGGIGYTPFLAVAQEYLGLRRFGDPPREAPRAQRVTFCYGARSAAYFAGLDAFTAAGCELRLSTDDGTRGRHGLVTELLTEVLREDSANCRVVCCGPERMMEAVAEITTAASIPCRVSLETPMACGIGICFTCVAKIRDESGEWDYRRTCIEGPVFDARLVEW